MRIVKLHSLLLIGALLACSIVIPATARPFAASTTGAAATVDEGPFPNIRKAIAALELADTDLENAEDDFCGYKAAAINAVNSAISELGLAIACKVGDSAAQAQVNQTTSNLRAKLAAVSYAGGNHPLIRKAIAACENAAIDLENAAHDYCGHRLDALNADLAAIGELELALSCNP
ncbi:MAG TPA: hypothetical protein VI756_25510 [Blastocatellia bacterium]